MRSPMLLIATISTLLVGCVSVREVTLEVAPPYERLPVSEGIEPRELALCLSGGGYRAMLFHSGALIALAEHGYLEEFDIISSVSGGSIVNAKLALEWNNIFEGSDAAVTDQLEHLVISPIQVLSGKTIDAPSVLVGIASPFHGRTGLLSNKYDRHLFKGATLIDMPDPDAGARVPVFVINATDIYTGRRWQFSNGATGGWPYGFYRRIRAPVADAVAASSALPPFFKSIKFDREDAFPSRAVVPGLEEDGTFEAYVSHALGNDIHLVDGGLVGNKSLDICRAAKRIFLSDATVLPIYQSKGQLDVARLSIMSSEIVFARAERDSLNSADLKNDLAQIIHSRDEGNQVSSDAPILVSNGFGRLDQLIYWIELRRRLSQIDPDRFALKQEELRIFDAVPNLICESMIPTRLSKLDKPSQNALLNFGYISTIGALEWSYLTSRLEWRAARPVPIKLPRNLGSAGLIDEPKAGSLCAQGSERMTWVSAYVSVERASARRRLDSMLDEGNALGCASLLRKDGVARSQAEHCALE